MLITETIGNALYIKKISPNIKKIRVLRYDNVGTLPITNAAATAVLGQPDFITATYGVASNKLYYPSDVFPTIDGVYVADGQNNRVVKYPFSV